MDANFSSEEKDREFQRKSRLHNGQILTPYEENSRVKTVSVSDDWAFKNGWIENFTSIDEIRRNFTNHKPIRIAMDFNILGKEKNGEFQRESYSLYDKTELTPHKQTPKTRDVHVGEDQEDWSEKVTSIDEFSNRQPIRLSLGLQNTTLYAYKGRHEDSDSAQHSQLSKDKHPSKYKSLVLAVLLISCIITLGVGLAVIFIQSNRNHDRLETGGVFASAEGEISINENFKQELNQTNSTVYQKFRKQFSNVMEESLREDFKFDRECEIVNLRKGSIIVRFVLFLEIDNKDITPGMLESAIRKSFKSENGSIYLGTFPVIGTSLSIFNITKKTKIRHSTSTYVHSSATRLPYKTTILFSLNSVNPVTQKRSTDTTLTSINPIPTTQGSSSATQIDRTLSSKKPTSSKFNGTTKTSGTFIPTTSSSSAITSTIPTSSTSLQPASFSSTGKHNTTTSKTSIATLPSFSTSKIKLHSFITSNTNAQSSGTPTSLRMTSKPAIIESTSITTLTSTTPPSISANELISSSSAQTIITQIPNTSVPTGTRIELTIKTHLPSASPPTGISSRATLLSTVFFSAFSQPSNNTPTSATTTSSASISTSTSSVVQTSITPSATASSLKVPFSSTPSSTTLIPNASSPKGLSSSTPISTPTFDASTLSGSLTVSSSIAYVVPSPYKQKTPQLKPNRHNTSTKLPTTNK